MTSKKIRNMDEFASLSGISRPTISKYFNDPNSVRPSTRDRIESALKEYDYRPNIYAMNQNRRLTKNIGIVVPYLADPFFAEIARVIERRCFPRMVSRGRKSPFSIRCARSSRLAFCSRRWAGHPTRPISRRSAAMCRPSCSTAISKGSGQHLLVLTTSVSYHRLSNI